MAPIALVAFDPKYLPLLGGWLRQPHVMPWYPHPSQDMELASNPPSNGGHVLVVAEGVPIGYMRWQHVDRETLDELGLPEVPENSVDIDILLGEVALAGKGVGPAALNALAARFLRDPTVPQLGLTTSVDNARAQRAFEKAGFPITRQYQPPGLGTCHLMIRDLAAERKER
jgi:aminoglycoside 6'-N-acetyltransferase